MASTAIARRHVVTFSSPTWNSPRVVMPLALPLPKNTMDIRYVACGDHRTACDCREAELSEEISELRWERDRVLRVLREELATHATWAYHDSNERDLLAECKCTGCVIVRRLDFYSIGGSTVTRSSEPGRTR
ncbi:hypothetical protein ACU635_14120 [[Actinomadura] parvosata]|uniref:hypothetical protein n=1 Tax=[Actinomadura] parvosata TaxID=1955412 RepID=UPI00406CBE6D